MDNESRGRYGAVREDARQRTIRGVIQSVVTLLTVAPLVLAIVLDQWSPAWLVAASAQVIAVQTVLTRVMAIPVVDEWLSRFGAGKSR